MPVSSSQGDSPREKNMGKVCQALMAMDYAHYASQFKSGRQSKRKEHGKGKYRPSGQWTTPSMPVGLSQGDSPREKNMGKVCTGPQGNGLHPVRQSA